MALQQVRIDNNGTFGGFDPTTNQAIAFGDEATFKKHFASFDKNAPLASFDTSNLLGANANKLMSLAPKAATPAPFTVDVPKDPIPSNAFTSNASFDLSSTLKDHFAKQDSVLASISTYMAPSPQEESLTKDINDVNDQYRNSTTNIEGKVIPLEDQMGEKDRAAKVANNRLHALSATLQSATASRTQKLEAAKFLYDTGRNTLKDTIEIYKQTAPENIGTYTDPTTGDFFVITKNPLTGQTATQKAGNVGTPDLWQANRERAQTLGVRLPYYMTDGRTVINASTGKAYEKWEHFIADGGRSDQIQTIDLASQPAFFETRQVGSQTIRFGFDQQGNIVSRVPLGSSGSGGGGSGGLLDSNGKPIKLSVGQQTDIVDIDTLSNLATQTLELGESIGFSGTGGLGQGSISQFLAKNFGQGSQQEEELRNMIGNIKGTLAKLRGGTSFTVNEQKLLESYTPGINDSALTIRAKLGSLQNFLSIKRAAIIQTAGGTVSATATTPSSQSTTSNESTPAQDNPTGFWSKLGNWLWGE